MCSLVSSLASFAICCRHWPVSSPPEAPGDVDVDMQRRTDQGQARFSPPSTPDQGCCPEVERNIRITDPSRRDVKSSTAGRFNFGPNGAARCRESGAGYLALQINGTHEQRASEIHPDLHITISPMISPLIVMQRLIAVVRLFLRTLTTPIISGFCIT